MVPKNTARKSEENRACGQRVQMIPTGDASRGLEGTSLPHGGLRPGRPGKASRRRSRHVSRPEGGRGKIVWPITETPLLVPMYGAGRLACWCRCMVPEGSLLLVPVYGSGRLACVGADEDKAGCEPARRRLASMVSLRELLSPMSPAGLCCAKRLSAHMPMITIVMAGCCLLCCLFRSGCASTGSELTLGRQAARAAK